MQTNSIEYPKPFSSNFAYCMHYAPIWCQSDVISPNLHYAPCIKYPNHFFLNHCLLHAVYTICSTQTNCIEYQKPPLFPQILLTACSAHHAVSKQTPQILLTACSTHHPKKSTQNHHFFLKFSLLHAVGTIHTQYANKVHRVPITTPFFLKFCLLHALCIMHKIPKTTTFWLRQELSKCKSPSVRLSVWWKVL